jgi:predicted nucleic acid-binding protein
MTLVFDTTALSRFLNEDLAILQVVASKEYNSYAIPFATDAEIRFGFINGSRQADELATWARKHGIALSNNDIWIAATCSQLGGRLLTLDGDFKHLPQIPQVDMK